VTLFFRVFQDQLTLTATFRSHNTMSAWLPNIYGLMALQQFVAERVGNLTIGRIIVISHSISIDSEASERLDLAQQIAEARVDDWDVDRETGKRTMPEDPTGYFAFTIDEDTSEIIADHKIGGDLLTRYRGRNASEIERQIARDTAVSLISHAMYIGRQLAIYEARAKEKRKRKE
jgi:thymidylate synthase